MVILLPLWKINPHYRRNQTPDPLRLEIEFTSDPI